jgi:hypothetical protein
LVDVSINIPSLRSFCPSVLFNVYFIPIWMFAFGPVGI